jgi:hypothetical protein
MASDYRGRIVCTSRNPIVAIDIGLFPISLNLTETSAIFIVLLENLFKNDLGSFSSLPPNSVLLVGPRQAAPSGIFTTPSTVVELKTF